MPLRSALTVSDTGPMLSNEPELIQCLYQSLHHQAGFHDFLAMLTESVNGRAAQLSFVRRNPRAIEHIWHAGLSDEFVGWYLDNNMIAHDAVTNYAITQQPGDFRSALPLLEKGPPGQDYGRWESDHQMLDSAWMVVDASDTHIILLTVQRTVAQGAYQPADLDAMNRLVPFVRQTVTLAETYHQRSDASQALAAIVEVICEPAFVLNNRGILVLSNQRGRELIGRGAGITLQHERFSFLDETAQKAFFRTITRVSRADLDGEDYEPETLVIRLSGASPVMMTLRPLRHNELLTGGVLVTITDAGARQFPDAEMIAEYFSLTRAEASVCEYLVKGLSLKEIAARKHKSEATVRSYLKQVFIKTGQSRQGQLVSTILSSLLR